MSTQLEVQMGQRGVVTLPKELREAYNLKPGDRFTLMDLEGVFLLSPRVSRIDELADRVAQELVERGETLEGMLKVLREERERYDESAPGLS